VEVKKRRRKKDKDKVLVQRCARIQLRPIGPLHAHVRPFAAQEARAASTCSRDRLSLFLRHTEHLLCCTQSALRFLVHTFYRIHFLEVFTKHSLLHTVSTTLHTLFGAKNWWHQKGPKSAICRPSLWDWRPPPAQSRVTVSDWAPSANSHQQDGQLGQG